MITVYCLFNSAVNDRKLSQWLPKIFTNKYAPQFDQQIVQKSLAEQFTNNWLNNFLVNFEILTVDSLISPKNIFGNYGLDIISTYNVLTLSIKTHQKSFKKFSYTLCSCINKLICPNILIKHSKLYFVWFMISSCWRTTFSIIRILFSLTFINFYSLLEFSFTLNLENCNT